VEAGETPRKAVVRELAEELGIQVRPVERIGAVQVVESRHILAIWRVVLVGGAIRPNEREIADFRWLSPDEIRRTRPGLPSNERVLELLGV
jgi:8-oxo-dGTP diphosphatase